MVGLDHLRALAAVLVVLWHGGHYGNNWVRSMNPALAVVQEGHSGVALFLVLSGFLFTTGARGKDIDYLPFLKNRVLRIFPLYLVVLLAGAAALPAQYTFAAFAQSVLLQANLNGAFKAEPFTYVLWTISIEFQFYLVFPALLKAFERDGVRWILACLLMATLTRLALFTYGAPRQELIYYHLVGRIDQFLIGMLTAEVFARIGHRNLPWGMLSIAAAAVVVGALWAFHLSGAWTSGAPWKALWPIYEGLAWASLIACYVPFAPSVPRLIGAPFKAVGTWSYSLYLTHFAVLWAMPFLIAKPAFSAPSFEPLYYTLRWSLWACIAVAALSYYTIERPFMALRVRYLRERSPAGERE